MRNRFLKDYNSKTNFKFSNIDKQYFTTYINNSENPNILATIRINKLKSDIISKNKNIPKKMLKGHNYYSKRNLLKPINKKSGLRLETIFFNDKGFIREFEDLFEQTTNNNITEFFNGRQIEKMEEVVKGIKEFNYNDFIKKLKRKKSKNKKIYIDYKPRNLSAQIYKPRNLSAKSYNYKDSSYSILTCATNQNENTNSDVYLNTTCASSIGNYIDDEKMNYEKNFYKYKYDSNNFSLLNSLRRELNNKLNKNRNKYFQRNDRRALQYKNEIERLKMFEKGNSVRISSYNPKNNRNKVDNLFYHCKTKKNLNLI